MKNYSWILFDADETLFHFDSFMGLQHTFSQFDIKFSEQDFIEYQQVNKPLWVEYQNGMITAQQLQCRRFSTWAERLQCLPQDLNSVFIASMAEICTPIDGARSLLSSLKGKNGLGIITNGFTDLQEARLERTGLKEFFDILVISEQVGIAKPDKAIFDHTLSIIGNPEPGQVLMVGDNLDSDILGGINAGLDTCWLNRESRVAPEEISPHYEVSSLIQLKKLLTT